MDKEKPQLYKQRQHLKLIFVIILMIATKLNGFSQNKKTSFYLLSFLTFSEQTRAEVIIKNRKIDFCLSDTYSLNLNTTEIKGIKCDCYYKNKNDKNKIISFRAVGSGKIHKNEIINDSIFYIYEQYRGFQSVPNAPNFFYDKNNGKALFLVNSNTKKRKAVLIEVSTNIETDEYERELLWFMNFCKNIIVRKR